MRRESSTVVAIVGEVADALLYDVGRYPNIAVARPPSEESDPLTAAASALRQASRKSAPFVLVPADPLAMVAAGWRSMWDISEGLRGVASFEARSAEALAAWRAKRFELPDYYLVLTRARTPGAGPEEARLGAPEAAGDASVPFGSGARSPAGAPGPAGPGPLADAQSGEGGLADLHLGPLRAARPRRVCAVVISEGADLADVPEQAARVLQALRTLSHGPWWPPLDELIDTVRRSYPGSLAEGGASLAATPGG